MDDGEIRETVGKAKAEYLKTPNFKKLGEMYDVSPAHFWRAIREGKAGPTLARALGTKRKRTRFSGDTDLAPDIAAEARRLDWTNGEFLEILWGYWNEQN
jgi:hypothetical protein